MREHSQYIASSRCLCVKSTLLLRVSIERENRLVTYFLHVTLPSGGALCAAASVIIFENEVACCAFFHTSRERLGHGLSRFLWNQIINYCSGKNIYAVMPHDTAVNFLRRYHFHVSVAGDIMYGLVRVKPTSFVATGNVRNYQADRDYEDLVAYDRSVFGFGRGYFLGFALDEAELTVKVAVTDDGRICGYVGVQKEQRGCPVLRWLLANDTSTAEALLHQVVETCEAVLERGILAAFYTYSPITQVILNKVDRRLLESWALVFNRREPFAHSEKIISLTYV